MPHPSHPNVLGERRSEWPVASTVAREQAVLLRAFSCVISDREAIYLSGPITTGQRFVTWFVATGHMLMGDPTQYEAALREQVVRENEQELLAAAAKVRQNNRVPVIEPSNLPMPGWQQSDYHCFWRAVVRQFVSKMIVVGGWEYSVGCAKEFQQAIEVGVVVSTVEGASVSAADGRALIAGASLDIEQKGRHWKRLTSLAEELRKCVE